ncbi:MAG: alkyl sulfatase dimerization domain-containing protein [Methylovulum sp.]|nr:alkyl sulfatase dimerization domain-containing protein [Methylovulum sp.]
MTARITPNDATQATKDANKALANKLNFNDDSSFINARRGFCKTLNEVTIVSQNNADKAIWDLTPYEYQASSPDTDTDPDDAPDTINPSLWRQAKLNTINGLFEVTDGLDVAHKIYQVRAFDMSNMTIIEGETGLIIVDPLISEECAKAALQLYRDYAGSTHPVKAVIFTHSHVDHFGGVLGLFDDYDAEIGGVTIIAPAGFMDHAVSENVYAGTAMVRRAEYMYGPYLEKNPKGQVDAGLGKGQSTGVISIASPTLTISASGRHPDPIDGIYFDFYMAPGSEAPSEFCFYLPDLKALCMAEDACHTLHNIQTLRGAQVRNALAWSKYLSELLELYGREAQVLFAQHHWPVWNDTGSKAETQAIPDFLAKQRDMYRYLNDQTLRMLNKGYTGIEIGEVFAMPPAIEQAWSCRGYYGSVSHNVKGVYDRYMGWFDGNPSNLHPLPPQQSSPLYINLMGGVGPVIAYAQEAYNSSTPNYRWIAELLHKVVFTEPTNTTAKHLLADTLEQLGYQAESGPWRNFYLMGAQELRGGILSSDEASSETDPSMFEAMTLDMLFDALGTHIVAPRMIDMGISEIVMNWNFTDPRLKQWPEPESLYVVRVSNGALSYAIGKQDANAGTTVQLSRDTFNAILLGDMSLDEAISSGQLVVTNPGVLINFFYLLDGSDPKFPIVTPRSDIDDAWNPPRAIPAHSAGKKRRDCAIATKRRRYLGPIPKSR